MPEPKEKPKQNFAIRIGAFSSYDKAMGHAKNIQNQFASKLLAQNIRIDKLERPGNAIYRAQITGLKKEDANKLCVALKSKKQECIAAVTETKTQFAER